MSVHEQVVYRNIYTFAIKKRLNEPFSEICPAPKADREVDDSMDRML
jgi:hypothetical protein